MTPEQITKLAREAGFSPQRDEWVFNTMLRTFAHLVRNSTLEEAAKQCDSLDNDRNDEAYRFAATMCAIKIRSLKT